MELCNVRYHLLDKSNDSIVRECGLLMSQSEPWITLRRTCEDVIKIIMDEMSEVHIAQSGAQLVGFAMIKMRGAFVGYIQSIVIAPEYRNKGIGKRFMEYLEQRIFSEHPNVFICVSSFNPNAKRLYVNLGYETIGALKNYIVRGHSEILMRKSRGPLSDFKAG